MESLKRTGDLQEVGENLIIMMKNLLANENLTKLLANTDRDPLSGPVPTKERARELVRVIPKVTKEENDRSIVVLRIVDGVPNRNNNEEFRDFTLHIEIFVPLTLWEVKSTNLRPFLIMGEIQKSLNKLMLNSMGKLTGGDFNLNFLTEEMSCYEQIFKFTTYA